MSEAQAPWWKHPKYWNKGEAFRNESDTPRIAEIVAEAERRGAYEERAKITPNKNILAEIDEILIEVTDSFGYHQCQRQVEAYQKAKDCLTNLFISANLK